MTLNPLRQAYSAIRTALLANADIAALFLGPTSSVGRLPWYDPIIAGQPLYYAPDPDIAIPGPADYPRAKLVFRPERRYWRGQGQELQNTSDTSTLRVQYMVDVHTGHQIQGRVMDACWALWTFSANWQTFLYENVTYGGNPCVTYAEPCEMDVLQVDNDQHKFQARGTDQWISVWGLTVCFDFLTSAMQSIG